MKKYLVIPLILALIVGGTACTGKTQVSTGITTVADVQAMVEALEAKVITLENRQNTAVSPADVTQLKNDLASLKTQINNLPVGITQAQVDASMNTTKSDVSALRGQITTLMAEVASLKTENAALKTDVAKLKEPPPVTTPTTASVEASIKYLFPSLTFGVTYPATAQTGSFRLDIKNNSSVVVKDVQLVIYFVQSGLAVNYSPNPTLSSGAAVGTQPIMWQFGGIQSNALLFANGLGFNLNPGEAKSLNLTLTLSSADAVSVQYTPYVFVS